MDGNGDLYVTNGASVTELPANGGTPIPIPSAYSGVYGGMAVDGAGDLFIGQFLSYDPLPVSQVSELPVGGGALTTVLGNLEYIGGVVVD